MRAAADHNLEERFAGREWRGLNTVSGVLVTRAARQRFGKVGKEGSARHHSARQRGKRRTTLLRRLETPSGQTFHCQVCLHTFSKPPAMVWPVACCRVSLSLLFVHLRFLLLLGLLLLLPLFCRSLRSSSHYSRSRLPLSCASELLFLPNLLFNLSFFVLLAATALQYQMASWTDCKVAKRWPPWSLVDKSTKRWNWELRAGSNACAIIPRQRFH